MVIVRAQVATPCLLFIVKKVEILVIKCFHKCL